MLHTSERDLSRNHTGTDKASSTLRKSMLCDDFFAWSGSNHTAAIPPTARPRRWISNPLRSCAESAKGVAAALSASSARESSNASAPCRQESITASAPP
ncbi:MAG: hypothetical protein WDM89_09690 [Rhizomicrobium sp.]